MATRKRSALSELPGFRSLLAVLAIFSLGQGACLCIMSLALASALAALWSGANVASQIAQIALVFAGFFGQRVIANMQDAVVSRYARTQTDALRHQVLESTFAGRGRPVRDEGTAALVTETIDGCTQIEAYLRLFPPKIVDVVAITGPLLISVFVLDWVSALILALVFPVVALYMTLLGRLARDYATQQLAVSGRLSNHFLDTLRGLGTLKAFGAAKHAGESIFRASEAFRVATVKTLRVATTSGAALDLICVLGLAGVAIMLAFRLMDGSLSLYCGLGCLILSPQVTNPLRAFGADFHASLNGRVALERLRAVVAANPVVAADDVATDSAWDEDSRLELDDVSFSYPAAGGAAVSDTADAGENPAPPALSRISFAAQGFERIGIIGPSGSGKSTLAALLGGFEVPTAGTIRVNGSAATSLDSPTWRRNVLFIPQNPTIFHTTLRANLTFYTPDATDETIDRAVAAVGLQELVAQLPNGLDTVIGEGGHGLSGGQAQRIALARALLDPTRRVLIFDEPTAHLDVETERELKERTLPLMEGRLVLFCTHRLHWLAEMDRVIVLEEGHIAWEGTPDALPARFAAPAVSLGADTAEPDCAAAADRAASEPVNTLPSGQTPTSDTASLPEKPLRAWMRPFLVQQRAPLAKSFALGAAWAVAAILLMFTSGYLISRTAEPGTLLVTIMPIVAFVQIFGLGRPFARYYERLASHDWVFRITSLLRARLYRALERTATALGSTRTSGDVLGVLADDIGHVQNLFLRSVFPAVVAVIACVLTVLALLAIDPLFALFAAVVLVIAAVVVPFIAGCCTREEALAVKRATADEYATLTDNVLGSVDWALSGRGADFVSAADDEHRRVQDMRARLRFRERLFDCAQALILAAAACAVIVWAGAAFALDHNWIAAFAIGFFPLAEFLAPLPAGASGIHEHRDSLQRIGELVDDGEPSDGEAADAAGVGDEMAPHEEPASLGIVVDAVTFSYPDNPRIVLHDVSLTIAPGEKVALLGRSGGGKSTLATLIHGDCVPTAGSVSVGGQPAARLGNSAPHIIGVLHQQAYVFNRTVRDNLTLGVMTASDDELFDALRAVKLEEAVRALPQGLGTVIAEDGGNLSGGQRQRLALARLLLARTPIVLLDEPFAALDPATEDALLTTLFSAFADRTLVLITHHLQGIERFDRVVFLEDGGVALNGTPKQLAASSEHFRRLLAFDRTLR